MALSGLLKDLDIAAVPHGFRSSLRDWAAEETNHSRVYDRYDYDAEKRKALEMWSRHLTDILEGKRGKVVSMRTH